MPKYMLIIQDGSETHAMFSDSYEQIRGWKMDGECGLGAYAEIYEREFIEEQGYEYQLLEA